jgi:hypothetical protein
MTGSNASQITVIDGCAIVTMVPIRPEHITGS